MPERETDIPGPEIFAEGESRETALRHDREVRRTEFQRIPCAQTAGNYRLFIGECRAIAGVYCWRLEVRLSPRPRATRDRMLNLADLARRCQEAYAPLADDEARLLAEVASRDPRGDEPVFGAEWDSFERENPFPRFWADNEPPGGPFGGTRTKIALHLVASLERWARVVADERAVAPGGRPRHDAERDAVQSLADLWQRLTGRDPVRGIDRDTGGPTKDFQVFTELALAVTWPAAGALGVKEPQLDHVIREVLGSRGEPEETSR